MSSLFRKTVVLLFAVSVCTFAASLAAQYILGMEPCVLCISQRLCVLAVGVVTGIAALNPQRHRAVAAVSALAVSIPALWGIWVASYQLWLQSLPAGTAPACGAPWTFRLRNVPLFDWFEPVVRGFGNCAEPDYLFGVPLPVWSLIYFTVIVLAVWGMWWKSKQPR